MRRDEDGASLGRRGAVAGTEARWARAADRMTGALASGDFDENVFAADVDSVAWWHYVRFLREKRKSRERGER